MRKSSAGCVTEGEGVDSKSLEGFTCGMCWEWVDLEEPVVIDKLAVRDTVRVLSRKHDCGQ